MTHTHANIQVILQRRKTAEPARGEKKSLLKFTLLYKKVQFSLPWWPGGVVVIERWTCDSKGRGFESRPFRFQVTTLGKLFTHMCLCHQAEQYGTGQGPVMPCCWEGNRRSGVALAMRHRLQWFIHLYIRSSRLNKKRR